MSDKEKINKLREELNESILKNEDYSKIYNLSISLDNLITEYYENYEKSLKNKEKTVDFYQKLSYNIICRNWEKQSVTY